MSQLPNFEKEHFERVFLAVGVEEPTSGALAELAEERSGFRWVESSQFHLTLRFVGEVDASLREAIAAKMRPIAVEPFILPVEKVGVFPLRGQPQVVYAGLGSAHPRLFQLQHRVEDALASLGLPLELRAFTPHITLARVSRASPQAVRAFIKSRRDFAAPPFRVESFGLYRSRMTHFGAQYELLESYPLRHKERQRAG